MYTVHEFSLAIIEPSLVGAGPGPYLELPFEVCVHKSRVIGICAAVPLHTRVHALDLDGTKVHVGNHGDSHALLIGSVQLHTMVE